jgi:hypothetical protein
LSIALARAIGEVAAMSDDVIDELRDAFGLNLDLPRRQERAEG